MDRLRRAHGEYERNAQHTQRLGEEIPFCRRLRHALLWFESNVALDVRPVTREAYDSPPEPDFYPTRWVGNGKQATNRPSLSYL